MIELLVVMTVIGILIGLLLPAVQAVRQTALRTQCSNNLANLGLAILNHETSLTFFPSGGRSWDYHATYVGGRPAVAPQQCMGWGYQILPYMDAANVHTGGNKTTDMEKSIAAISTIVPQFFCPLRRSPQLLPPARDWYKYPENSGKTFAHSPTDYASSRFCDASLAGNKKSSNGIIIHTPKDDTPVMTIGLVRDGMSNTMMLGEKMLNIHHINKSQRDDNEGYTSGWDWDTVRCGDYQPQKDKNDPSTNVFGDWRFGGSHPGTFNAVFGDKTVRTLSVDIDILVFRRITDAADSEIFTMPE